MTGKSIGFIKIIQEELNQCQFVKQNQIVNRFSSFNMNALDNYELNIHDIENKITPIYLNTCKILLDLVIHDLNFILHLKVIKITFFEYFIGNW